MRVTLLPSPRVGIAKGARRVNDYKGAALMIDAFPRAKTLLADRGYDADGFRAALEQCGITPCNIHPAGAACVGR